MDDLIFYVRGLLAADTTLAAIPCRAPKGDAEPQYPEFVISASDGEGVSQGEPGVSFINGELRLATYARDTDGQDGNSQMWSLANAAAFIIGGDKYTGKGGILGQRLAAVGGGYGWTVTKTRRVSPSGPQADQDPKVSKHVSTFQVQLLRHSL